MIDQPKVVTASARLDMLVTGIRQAGLIAGGTISILGFLRGRDLAGLIDYVRGGDFVPFAMALGTAGLLAWGQLAAWRRKRELVHLAEAAPDRVAIVSHVTLWQRLVRWWEGSTNA